MKRSGPPDRDPEKTRAWRARSKPLKSSGQDRSTRKNRTSLPARRRSLKAKPLDPVEKARRADVREAVFRRDGYRCRLERAAGEVDGEWIDAGPCHFGLTPHHVHKDGQGGAYDEANLVTLCAHHNDEIEANPRLARLARSLGLVKRRADLRLDES